MSILVSPATMAYALVAYFDQALGPNLEQGIDDYITLRPAMLDQLIFHYMKPTEPMLSGKLNFAVQNAREDSVNKKLLLALADLKRIGISCYVEDALDISPLLLSEADRDPLAGHPGLKLKISFSYSSDSKILESLYRLIENKMEKNLEESTAKLAEYMAPTKNAIKMVSGGEEGQREYDQGFVFGFKKQLDRTKAKIAALGKEIQGGGENSPKLDVERLIKKLQEVANRLERSQLFHPPVAEVVGGAKHQGKGLADGRNQDGQSPG